MELEIISRSPIFSIKPFYLDKIISKEKTFEFRNKLPNKFNNYYWVYESSPVKELKYLMKVDFPIEYPTKIDGVDYGVERFNNGEMNVKYAYKILKLYKLANPITRETLINIYGCIPPQSYTYLFNYKKLQKFLESENLICIF